MIYLNILKSLFDPSTRVDFRLNTLERESLFYVGTRLSGHVRRNDCRYLRKENGECGIEGRSASLSSHIRGGRRGDCFQCRYAFCNQTQERSIIHGSIYPDQFDRDEWHPNINAAQNTGHVVIYQIGLECQSRTERAFDRLV